MPTTTIDAEAPLATLINIFTVPPERQSELGALLVAATEDVMQQLPGVDPHLYTVESVHHA